MLLFQFCSLYTQLLGIPPHCFGGYHLIVLLNPLKFPKYIYIIFILVVLFISCALAHHLTLDTNNYCFLPHIFSPSFSPPVNVAAYFRLLQELPMK